MHRRRRRSWPVATLLVAIAIAIVGVGCGGDDTADIGSSAPVAIGAVDTTAESGAIPTVTQQPVVTEVPATTAAPTTTMAGPVVIEVDGDAAVPVERAVARGTDVQIVVTSTQDQELHLHGYDLEQTGTRVTFVFTATQAGTFELERHHDGGVVLLLTVV